MLASRLRQPDAGALSLALAGVMLAGLCFLVAMAAAPAHLVLAATGAAVLVVLTAWRPLVGCAALVLAPLLTTGLGRDTVLPFFRPNEAVLLLVLVGLVLYHLPRREPLAFSGLDLAVGAFIGAAIGIPAAVLVVTHSTSSLDTWREVFAPVQYLAYYWAFSRTRLSGAGTRLVLNLAMAATVVVGVLALLEVLNVPGVRDLVATYFPRPPDPFRDPVYRPTSLLGHFSSVGALGMAGFALAFALATSRHPGYPAPWLALVMFVNVSAVLASQTWAAAGGLVVIVAAIAWYCRRLPRELLPVLAAGVVVVALLWPLIGQRVQQQQLFDNQSSVATPETWESRLILWDEIFLPVLSEHIWTGTGTELPSDVPTRLLTFVDNEYIRLAFRAGVAGVVLLLVMYATFIHTALGARTSRDPTRRALGALVLSFVLALLVMGMTAEYLTFTGISQLFWTVAGLLGSYLLVAQVRPGTAIIRAPQPARLLPLREAR